MRTRCPGCATTFNITPEQLRAKGGKVRCGQCGKVFNALDDLLETPAPAAAVAAPLTAPLAPPQEPVFKPLPEPEPEPAPEPILEVLPEPAAPTPDDDSTALDFDLSSFEPDPEPESLPVMDEAPTPVPAELPPLSDEDKAPRLEPQLIVVPDEPVDVDDGLSPAAKVILEPEDPEPAPEPTPAPISADVAESAPEESTDATTQAAREAGLVALRELGDQTSHNRWAAGTLAGSHPLAGIDSDGGHRPTWPFTLASLIFFGLLLAQVGHYFRTEIVQRLPATAGLYAALGIDIPLPRQVELVAIDASDLQSDAARGLFVLNATLVNRAPYAQEWPALELTLTDARDALAARRVLQPADYLPPGSPAQFAPRGELATRLWIEAKDISASGYRLYVFYP